MKVKFRRIADKIARELESATHSVKIAIAWFTNENLFEILIDLLDRGINIEIITINDRINNHEKGLDFNKFIAKGGEFFFSKASGTMHHKFAIIDELRLISGSYNWTYNAEYRNQENIITTDNKDLIKSFSNEFERLKDYSILQEKIISIKPKETSEIAVEKYIEDDLIHKSIDQEKKGDLKKSVETLRTAKKISKSDNDLIQNRINAIEEKIKNPIFHYHVEDGQFSFDFKENYLIGKEGEVVEVVTDRVGDLEHLYILFIDGNYVECIGNAEREFPQSKGEHDRLKEWTLEQYHPNT